MKPLSLIAIVAALFLIFGGSTPDVWGEGGGHGGSGDHKYGGQSYGGHGYGGHDYVGHRYGGHGSWRGSVWIGPGWGPWWNPWWGPYTYPYPYGYYGSSVVIEREPYLYETPEPQAEVPYYWYFCNNPKGYYPYVQHCPGGWTKVLPSTPDGKE